jgi:hypothetical protein
LVVQVRHLGAIPREIHEPAADETLIALRMRRTHTMLAKPPQTALEAVCLGYRSPSLSRAQTVAPAMPRRPAR